VVTRSNDPIAIPSKEPDKGRSVTIRHPTRGTPPLTSAFAVTHRRGGPGPLPRVVQSWVHWEAQLNAVATPASTTRPARPSRLGRGVEKFTIEPPETRQSPPNFSPYAFQGPAAATARASARRRSDQGANRSGPAGERPEKAATPALLGAAGGLDDSIGGAADPCDRSKRCRAMGGALTGAHRPSASRDLQHG
jgi:hypothetical protein